MLFCLAHHLVDVAITQTTRSCDGDLLLGIGRFIYGGHVDDAIGIDIERNLDLRHAAWCGRDALQVELSQRPVIRGHAALAL